MPIITKISAQKTNTERFNLFIDEKYAFSVDADVLARFQLSKGKELSALDLTEIEYQDDIRKGVNSAIQFLSFRMRSEKEVRDYLKKSELDEAIIQEVIHKLFKRNYLNDLEFAKAYVRTQMNTAKKGPVILKQELQAKGINVHEIELALEEYSNELQVENAMALAVKTIKQNRKLAEKMVQQKMEQVLVRKGFMHHTINIVLEEAAYEKGEDEQWEAIMEQGRKAHRRFQKFEGFEYAQKMKQALYRKGFPIELIERFIEENAQVDDREVD
ncbi:recombination regulator RecX [Heyndrickxia acidicola]|uniref:Regulatory protein RecX n=1 Tax=Heyndrickxia acidicola TaxID=209389 RepID=A0ABU6MKR0_9BACI|nr:recombination regulator RecX [Heyndrickxia acidicola]MED1204982.1 recombination regulator RecX [Heyndrickxia acidicola]